MRSALPQDIVPMFNTRQAIEDEIERLLGLLNALDGDPDLEEQCEDEGAPDPDLEPDDNGIGDSDGLCDVYARAGGTGKCAA